MTKEAFWKFCRERILYLDGATGSNLMKQGMPAGVCPESWILEHSEILKKLQQDYIEAGSDIVYAPTFTSNRIKLAEYGLAEKTEEFYKLINTSIVK